MARAELRRSKPRGELWTPANIGDAAVALACAIGAVFLIVL